MKEDELEEWNERNFSWIAWLLLAIFMALLLGLCGYYWVLLLNN